MYGCFMSNNETIYEEKMELGNNDSMIKKGIYKEKNGSYTWMTAFRSGNVKLLKTAKRKIGLD